MRAVSIADLVETYFGDADKKVRDDFLSEIERLIEVSDKSADHVIDPISGLQFYPVPKNGRKWKNHAKTLPRAGRYRSHNPTDFLFEEYGEYKRKGLLYSGHIRRSDPALYDSIRMAIRTSNNYRNLDDFFSRNGILTPSDLAEPSNNNRACTIIITRINIILAGRAAILGQITTHQKRRMARQTRSALASNEGPA